MNLAQALRINKPQSVAFVGAGGKTSAMFHLAHQLSTPVLVTATTHIGTWQAKFADRHLRLHADAEIDQIEEKELNGVVLLTGSETNRERFSGLNDRQIEQAYHFAHSVQIPLLIEADGSRQRPIKAPDIHEPVIPKFVDLVVVVAGLSAIDKNLNEQWVHRPKQYARITGLSIEDRITSDSIVRMLIHQNGGLKAIPKSARIVTLLNQAVTRNLKAVGKRIAIQLLSSYQSVIVASLEVMSENKTDIETDDHRYFENEYEAIKVFAVLERVAAVILAAGGSSRLGEPKQLLQWRGKTFIEHVISIAEQAGLEPIIIVAGAHSDRVTQVVSSQKVQIVINSAWEKGQSTSIRAGLENLSKEIGAVVFLLVDQPQVSPRLVQTLRDAHAGTLAPIIAPQINGQRGNPVLFDRVTFPELMNLEGDIGGRALFSRFSPTWVEWFDESALQDVDTLVDYQRLISD
jgi:molybdenum cofactor cytidylyltransferase